MNNNILILLVIGNRLFYLKKKSYEKVNSF